MTKLITWVGGLPAHWLSLFLLTIYLFTYAGVLHSVDELATLTVTESLVVAKRWHTNGMAWDQTRTPPQNAPGIDGNLYSKKGIGISLVALPFFALGKAWSAVDAIGLALLTNALLTAVTAYLFYNIAITLDFPPVTAAWGALALGLATPLWPYARTLFSETLAALGLCLALASAFRYRQLAATQDGARVLWSLSGGLAILVLARSANAILLAPILCYPVYSRWIQPSRPSRWLFSCREMLALGLPIGGALLLTLLYNYLRFHTWLTFPQADFETFSTPLTTGLGGLLISPGKGLLWYMPLTLLLAWGLPAWRQPGRLVDYGLALLVIILTLLFYAKWYDWTGGRAWGPRLVVTTVPALVLLCLPALDRLRQPTGSDRWWIGGCLLLSTLIQLPGVLLNVEWLEAEQMKAGATIDQLLWSPAHSPLLTYWRFFSSAFIDPSWWRISFWQQSWLQTGSFILVGFALLTTLWLGSRRARQAKPSRPWWLAGVYLALFFAVMTVKGAATDPRRQEQTAPPADNQAVAAYLHAQAQAGDIVLLDMTAATDHQGRQRFWMNNHDALPYITWMRNSPALTLDPQLARWLTPYARFWLVMQETVENAPDATTERWLDQHAYRGRQLWAGSQRIVEYMASTQHEPLALEAHPIHFGNVAILDSYRVRPGHLPTYLLLDLVWQAKPADEWRFSVQALDSKGQVAAQLDDTPARLPALRDQLGLPLPPDAQQLILKIYHSQDGRVALVETTGQPIEFVSLFTFKE